MPQLTTDFSEAMNRLGPFEQNPTIAVALSGGSDSLCLTLLLHQWVQQNKGSLIALTVNHGLRNGSDQEALKVKDWMQTQGIEHHILSWTGPKPTSAIQEQARQARYQLLEAWCRDNHILHLCVGHTADDQNETALFRFLRGSGVDGLAGMSMVLEKKHLRILRPLLNVSRETLRQKLQDFDQSWIEDPSNFDEKFTRVQLRNCLSDTKNTGFSASNLQSLWKKQGRARVALEQQTLRYLSNHLELYPEGYARLSRKNIQEIPQDIIQRSLSWILMTIGGQTYPSRSAQLQLLQNAITSNNSFKQRTCGGCLISTCGGHIQFVREYSHIKHEIILDSCLETTWDQRFALSWPKSIPKDADRYKIAKLGPKGWKQIAPHLDPHFKQRVPAEAGFSLPAVWADDEVRVVPHLQYGLEIATETSAHWIFSPKRSLGPPLFMIA